jgi:hypothetical protein
VIEGDVALDTPGENEGQEDRGSERVRVGSDDTLLEAIEHILDERDGNEH